MSHLSVLPTVLRDADCLNASLRSLGLEPQPASELAGFADERHPVAVRVVLGDGTPIGWARQQDGSLALVGDLQRLNRCRDLPRLLSRITQAYAARQALQQAASAFPPGAQVEVQSLPVV
ncbi:MAG: DUF1257 domain-containing protein [Cyanobacteriota bacterium]|jgi:hypothetical protein|nr:DUF1257 domain-containing protein [Cyanobacteriota bacterium]